MELVNVGTVGHIDHDKDDKPRMLIIGAGNSVGKRLALALAQSLCMHVEYQSEEEEAKKLGGIGCDLTWLDELEYTDPYKEPRKSRGKGKKNKPWEHNYV